MKKQEIKKILSDKKASGKEKPWRARKIQSVRVSETLTWGAAYEYMLDSDSVLSDDWETLLDDSDRDEKDRIKHIEVGSSRPTFAEVLKDLYDYKAMMGWLGAKSEKMYDCGSTLEFAVDSDNNKKLYRAWFCKDRLCPMCNWRRSIKLREQVLKIMLEIDNRKIDGIPIFLTLTMKNVKGKDIGKSFSDYAEAFHRLMKYKDVKKICLGAIRTSELTYKPKRDDYNTHIHCLLWVVPDYFIGRNYISQDRWTTLWKKAAKLYYTPIVHVRKVKPMSNTKDDFVKDDEEIGYIKSILEITKYTAKLMTIPGVLTQRILGKEDSDEDKEKIGECMSYLERGLYRKRLISFFGIFKDIHKELDLDDVEDGDLIGANEDGDGTANQVVRYEYDYTKRNYYLTGVGDIRENGMIFYDE